METLNRNMGNFGWQLNLLMVVTFVLMLVLGIWLIKRMFGG